MPGSLGIPRPLAPKSEPTMTSLHRTQRSVYAHSKPIPKRWKRTLKNNLTFYLFIAPWLIGFLALNLYPLLFSIYLSFTEWDIISPMQFVGFDNYRTILFEDPLFWKSISVTAIYTLFAVPLGICVSLFIAILLNQRIRGLKIWRTIFYLPTLISGVSVSLIWTWIFNPDTGILNEMLRVVGIKGPMWIYDPFWVIPSLVIMSLWGAGGNMMIFLAGLQSIPTELYEAAELDGASRWQSLRHITLPMLSPVLFFVLVLSLIGSFQTFTQAYVMTEGGPDNASLFYVLYLFRHAFEYFSMGYASALAWILFVIIMSFTIVLFRTQHRWVHYESPK